MNWLPTSEQQESVLSTLNVLYPKVVGWDQIVRKGISDLAKAEREDSKPLARIDSAFPSSVCAIVFSESRSDVYVSKDPLNYMKPITFPEWALCLVAD